MATFTTIIKNNHKAIFEKYSYFHSSNLRYAMYSYSKAAKNPICYYNQKKHHKSKEFEVDSRILDYCSIFVFNEGNYGFIFNDNAYHPSRGDIFIVKNNVEFSSFFSQNTYIDCHEITFPMDFFEHFNDDSLFHKIFFKENETGFKIVKLNDILYEKIHQKFNKLDEIIQSTNDNADILSFSYIIQILETIYSRLNNQVSVKHLINVPHKLYDALNFIHENFTEPITTTDIANHCNITPTYLARMFKSVYQNTPIEYITTLRITLAKRLLREGQSISDACYNSGFNNYNYFLTKFKSITGHTPSKYRKR